MQVQMHIPGVKYEHLSCEICIFAVLLVRELYPDPDGSYTNYQPKGRREVTC
jgi:hypothetical protein